MPITHKIHGGTEINIKNTTYQCPLSRQHCTVLYCTVWTRKTPKRNVSAKTKPTVRRSREKRRNNHQPNRRGSDQPLPVMAPGGKLRTRVGVFSSHSTSSEIPSHQTGTAISPSIPSTSSSICPPWFDKTNTGPIPTGTHSLRRPHFLCFIEHNISCPFLFQLLRRQHQMYSFCI